MKTKTTFYSCLSAMSLMFCLSAQPALGFVSVSVSPGSQVAFVGSNVVFNAQVNATAGETITGYTWLTSPNGQNPFTTVPGATTATCTLVNVQTNQTGSYFVKVTYNAGGSIGLTTVSSAVTLAVVDQARITVQPQGGLIRIVGDSASFSVSALGFPPPGYQWRFNGMSLANDARISGANTTNLTLTSLVTADTGSYDVVVTNAYSSVTSQVATLGVYLPVGFSVPPQDTTVIVTSNAVFSVTASGSEPLSYLWQRSGTNLTDGGRISSATNAVLTIAATQTSDAGGYTVVVSNSLGSLTSSVATLTVLVPVNITSRATASGKQGVSFSFTTTATGTPPIVFGAAGLPAGLSLNPATGVIAGTPIFSGTFLVSIGATNLVNSDSQVLTLTITSSVPMITSATSATGTENQGGFSYTIRATDSPILFGASALPLGLSVDTTSGAITGTPLFAGTFTVSIWAINAWGTGSTNLVLNISQAPIGGLAITDVSTSWAKPYLLDFTFSLRDGTNRSTSTAVVVPANQLQVVCMEDGVPISSENPYILESASALSTTNQLKTILVLDYTASMFAVPGAIDAMQAAAELLINEEPAHAQFGIWEFHADYANPQSVTTNGFTKDKAYLIADIEGIQTNYVKGNYAGTRCWDAMYAALKQFGPTNGVQQRYLVAMTDGNDDSSLLNTNTDPVTILISLAQTNQVQIFCVAFGNDVNTNALLQLTSQTGGHYYLAAETTNLATQFQLITKDISSQYVLRWATLRRTAQPFQPSFQVTYAGFTDTFNTNLIFETNEVYMTNLTVDPGPPPVTNIDITTNLVVTNILSLPFNPPDWSNDVRVGSLLLAPDVDIGPQTIRLQAFYVPRYIREIQINYRPNYPCTASLASTGTNDILYGWTMTETTDTNGLRTLTLVSPDPTNQLSGIQYAAFGDLVQFDFNYPDALTTAQAFSVFNIDNSIYNNTNMLPNGQSFTNQNFSSFIKLYPLPPPHGTPIPWLIYYGFTTNFSDAELVTTNGLPVWQDYVAGLNPTNATSRFAVSTAFTPGQVPQIIFNTVAGRTYRVETATSLDTWAVLRDNIPGTGGNILFVDDRVLSGVNPVFYRVAVY